MPDLMPTIILWLFVVNLGIAFGAGLYESVIAVPQGSECRRASGAVLVWLMVIAGTVSAQEPPLAQVTDLSLPRIDWVALAAGRGASVNAPADVPGLAFQVPPSQASVPPPEPQHTGFKALVIETGRDFKAFPRRRSTWVILAIGGAGAALAHPADDSLNARLAGSEAAARFFAPGKYIGSDYVLVGSAVSLYLIGRYMLPHAAGEPKTNKVSHLGFDLLRSLIVSQALTHGIKLAVQRDRPTGECCAFPSGHSSATFAVASVLERHLGYRASWPMFLVATYVATSRLHDNRHFLSDVIFGASLGIASGWTVVGRHGRSNYAVMPVPVRGGAMVTFTRKEPRQAQRALH